MFDFIKNMLGGSNEKEIRRLMKTVDKINALEPRFHAMSDDELRDMTAQFKNRVKKGETLDDLLPEAFAAGQGRRAARVLGMRPFDVQLHGRHRAASGPHRRDEDRRGQDAGGHAARLPQRADRARACTSSRSTTTWPGVDSEWMGKVYRFLGLTVGLIEHDMEPQASARSAYAADITYGTNNELGFDYLRDNMVI